MNPRSGLVMLSRLMQLKVITKIKAHLQNLHYFSLRKISMSLYPHQILQHWHHPCLLKNKSITPEWDMFSDFWGSQGIWRSLDAYSPRYSTRLEYSSRSSNLSPFHSTAGAGCCEEKAAISLPILYPTRTTFNLAKRKTEEPTCDPNIFQLAMALNTNVKVKSTFPVNEQ